MALTATAQSAFPSRWGDEIVPTLRKRLQNESRILTKRMSGTPPAEDASPQSDFYQERPNTSGFSHKSATTSSGYSRPSGIPRPSTSTRPADLPTDTSPKTTPAKRPRTYSQPLPHEPNNAAGPSSRAASPAPPRPSDVRPTRIPVPRGRSPSFSNAAAVPSANGYPNGHYQLVNTSHDRDSSPDVQPQLRRQDSEIMQEQAPFERYAPVLDAPRPSQESEERPFEHWYRGDTSRNGGVGELRVGKRAEMMEIASYGHSYRNVASSSRAASRLASTGQVTEFGSGSSSLAVRRPRTGSVGARHSFYMDEDANASGHVRVLDEAPPTDVEMSEEGHGHEDDSDTEGESAHTYSYTNHLLSRRSESKTSLGHTIQSPDTTANGRTTPQTPVDLRTKSPSPATKIAKATSAKNTTPVKPRPSPKLVRGMTEPGNSSIRSNTSAPRSPASRHTKTPSPTTTRGRTQSAAKSPSSATKRGGKTPTQSRKPGPKPSDRPPVGTYSGIESLNALEGDESLADAIPTWTQPKSKGNWDEVVLPAVARKKGLEEMYEVADGSPKPKPPPEPQYEPAPGTFGWKHRPPQEDYRPDEIPLSDLGGQELDDEPMPPPPKAPEPVQDVVPEPPRPASPPPPIPEPVAVQQPPPPQRAMSPRSESPLPFASYTQEHRAPVQQIRPKEERWQAQAPPPPEEEVGAGCCSKCVIM